MPEDGQQREVEAAGDLPAGAGGLLSLTDYTKEDAEWLKGAQNSKLLDPGVRVVGVGSRDPDTQRPAVLVCYPLRVAYNAERSTTPSFSTRKWDSRSGTAPVPFPNTFWLVCPKVTARVGALEHQGLIARYKERLEEESNHTERAAFTAAHERCAQLRWSLLTSEDKSYAQEKGYEEALRGTGIGGLRYPNQIKCLHLHTAHYLATGDNIVGRWVQQELERQDDQQLDCKETPGTNR